MRPYSLKTFLAALFLVSAGSARAEVLVQPAYNPCEYARNQIKNANTYNIGGIVGDNWLQAALCQTTAEACTDIGSLCAGGVGYDELDQLCSPGNQLRICVPKDSIGDEDGVCVAFTDGCPANAGMCEKAGCSFKDWSPIPEPVPDTGGGVAFLGAVYDRPEACVYTPFDDGSPACGGGGSLQIPPPPPTEHPCDEYDWGSHEWWCCVEPLSDECLPGDVGILTCEDKYPNDPQAIACCKDPTLPGCNEGDTGGTGTGGTGGGGTGTGGGTCCDCCNGCDPEDPGEPEAPGPNAPQPTESSGAGFLCTVTALDAEEVGGKFIAVNKDGIGISLLIEHSSPEGLSGASHVELSQTAGPAVTMTGPADVPFDPKTSWTVQMGRPEKMMGEYIPNAAFLVTVYGPEGQVLHQTACEEEAGLHSQGSGSSGCALVAQGAPEAASWPLWAAFLLLPATVVQIIRRKSRATAGF